jgi:hypothetical protein
MQADAEAANAADHGAQYEVDEVHGKVRRAVLGAVKKSGTVRRAPYALSESKKLRSRRLVQSPFFHIVLRGGSVDVPEPLHLLDDFFVGARVHFDLFNLAFEDVLNQLLGRRVAGRVRAAFDAVVEVFVEFNGRSEQGE